MLLHSTLLLQQNALDCLKSRNLTVLADLVNEGGGDAEDTASYPLPDGHWINKTFDEEDGMTLLMMAISQGLHDYAEVLLQAGASARLYSSDFDSAPIHLAATKGDLRSLKLLFRDQRNMADVNATVQENGWSALHFCAKHGHDDCIKFLLGQHGVDVNLRAGGGRQTPLYLAAKARNKTAVRALLENGANMDVVCFGKAVREHIKSSLPEFDPDAVKVLRELGSASDRGALQRMIDILSFDKKVAARYTEEFKKLLVEVDHDVLSTHSLGGYTMLQILTDKGLHELMEWLLETGKVDPHITTDTARLPPLLISADRGDVKAMKLLIEHGAPLTAVDERTQENVLHFILKNGDAEDAHGHAKCLEHLLTDEKLKPPVQKLINKRDNTLNSALHYATRLWPQDIVRKLLEAGANIGLKNHWNEVPISRIQPETMEEFLNDHCIQSQGEVNHESLQVTFDYTFLAPPVDELFLQGGINSIDPEEQNLQSTREETRPALPETESLWYLGQSKEHRHLLKHPVITSFLYLKWGLIRKDFNRNLRFYLIFVFMLTWFIFESYGGKTIKGEKERTMSSWHTLFGILSLTLFLSILRDWTSDMRQKLRAEKIRDPEGEAVLSSCKVWLAVLLANWMEALFLVFMGIILATGSHVKVLWTSLVILIGILLIREMFQALISLKRYFFSPENWLEIAVIILGSIILFDKDQSEETKRHLAAVAIVLSWAELITLVGKHPKLTRYNIYVVMFYKVMGTFFFFLCWYAFFIVAFGLGFYIMLHKDGPQDPPPSKDDYIFFNSPWLSLVKTSTMFVGELEFSDIPIQLETSLTPLAYIFFLSFVFLIVVVLMNLLNGLAVSDTGIIQEEAEIVSYISRVDTISYAESILLGDPFNFLSNWPALRWIRELPSCSLCSHLYKNRAFQRLLQRFTGIRNLLLFYDVLPSKKLTIKPNIQQQSCNLFQVR